MFIHFFLTKLKSQVQLRRVGRSGLSEVVDPPLVLTAPTTNAAGQHVFRYEFHARAGERYACI